MHSLNQMVRMHHMVGTPAGGRRSSTPPLCARCYSVRIASNSSAREAFHPLHVVCFLQWVRVALRGGSILKSAFRIKIFVGELPLSTTRYCVALWLQNCGFCQCSAARMLRPIAQKLHVYWLHSAFQFHCLHGEAVRLVAVDDVEVSMSSPSNAIMMPIRNDAAV
jgi:hypothetical protein